MKKEICKERSLKEGITGRGDRRDDGGSGEMKGEECVGKKVCQEEGEGGGKQEVVIELYTLTTKTMRRPKITSWRCYATVSSSSSTERE